MSKQGFDVSELDSGVTKSLLERVKIDERVAEQANKAADKANAALTLSQSLYVGYFQRVCDDLKVDATAYSMNFITNRLEPILPPEPPVIAPPVKAPDADEPPAPFRDSKGEISPTPVETVTP